MFPSSWYPDTTPNDVQRWTAPPFDVITHRPHLDTVFIYGLLLPLIAYDLWSLQRVHKATIWGSLFVVVAQALRIPIGMTHHPWLTFAGRIQHLGH